MIYILKFRDDKNHPFEIPFNSMKQARQYFAMEKKLWALAATIYEMKDFKLNIKLHKPINQTEWIKA